MRQAAIVAALWLLSGVLLWMRAMRVYGRGRWFNFAKWSGPCCPSGFVCQHPPPPAVRLALHVAFAPVILAAVLWYNIAWNALKKIGAAAERFAEWYAEFAKREREIEHKVGLERERQKHELDAAKREALVGVREENLKADRDRFEAQMKFQEERFTKEVGYLKDTLAEVLKRLPSAEFTANLSGVATKRSRR